MLVASGTFRLKGSHLLKLAKERGIENPHQLSLIARLSYNTVHRMIVRPDKVEMVDLDALFALFDAMERNV